MSEGFDEEEAMLGLQEHLKKKEEKNTKVTRCIALNKFSRRCRNRAKGEKDYCEIHLLKFFGEDPDDESDDSDSSTTGKVVFVDDKIITKHRMVAPRYPTMPVEIDDSTERYLIHSLETIVDHKDRIDPVQMSIYDYIQMMNLQESLKKEEPKEELVKFDSESKLWLEVIGKYGAGCMGGVHMDEAFENGTLEKKYFKLLQNCNPSKYMGLDMEEEFRKNIERKRTNHMKYGLFSA
jgi:hypothetical protein